MHKCKCNVNVNVPLVKFGLLEWLSEPLLVDIGITPFGHNKHLSPFGSNLAV